MLACNVFNKEIFTIFVCTFSYPDLNVPLAKKEKKQPLICRSWSATIIQALVLLPAGLVLIAKSWISPVEHKQFHRTSTSDKVTL